MKHVLAENGDTPFTKITRKVIVAGRDRRSKRPASARHFLDTMKGLFAWALDAEHVTVDPAIGIGAPKPKEGTGFKIWTEDEVARYEARWPIGTKERVWFDVLLYTGLRRGDAVRIGRQHLAMGPDGVEATLKTEKSGHTVEVTIPILPVLMRTLEAGPIGELAFIVGKRGRPFVKESFGNEFKDACRAAGIDERGKAAHGMRKVAATRCAEAGATVHQMMALFGWLTEKEALHYTKTANRKRMAREAAQHLATKRGVSAPEPSALIIPLKARSANAE
jgi:integrase